MSLDDLIAHGMAKLAGLEETRALVVAAPLPSAAAQAATGAALSEPLSGLDDGLADLFFATSGAAESMASHLDSSISLGLAAAALSSDGQYVTIDASVRTGGDAKDLLAQLQGVGLKSGASYGGTVSGELPVASLGQISSLSLLGQAHASVEETAAGAVQSQVVKAEHVDVVQAAHDAITGAGLRIGILSTSFNTDTAATTHEAGDIASGDLPADTVIVAEGPANSTDEGRAMAQVVHDIASGASIDFATGEGGAATFAKNIIALAQHGDKVIVDDFSAQDDLFYQNGVVAQAIETVIKDYGVTYISAASNNSNHGWEGLWANGSTFNSNNMTYTSLAFGPGQDYLPITLANAGEPITVLLQWDEPGASAGGPGATSDIDVFVYTDPGLTKLYASVTSNQIGADPISNFALTSTSTNQTFYIRVAYNNTRGGGPPPEVRLISADDGRPITLGTTDSNLNQGASHGHSVGGGAIGTAAASYAATPAYDGASTAQIEPYSTVGVDKITYSDTGVRLTTPTFYTPQITGVDAGDNTFFGPDIDHDGLPNFSGTSAAAPAVAAVAALLLQANTALTRDDVLALLQDSALDLDNPYTSGFDAGFDNATGSGLVQADLAVNFALGSAIANASQTTLQGTHLNDVIVGSGAADTLIGGAGNDQLDGGDGTDTAVYTGRSTDYALTLNPDGSVTLTDHRVGSPDGSDTLRNIERLQFADATVPTPVPLDTAVTAAFAAILREDVSSLSTSALTVALASQSDAAAVAAIGQFAQATTEVATLAYQFFTGHTPTSGGIDYLVSPTGANPNNLNSAYYAEFNAANRYINFAVNLGKIGEGAPAFQASYGALSLADATAKAYAAIFGAAPIADKVNQLLHDLVPNGLGGAYEREDYFASYGQDGLTGLGTKAAAVGWLLSVVAQGDTGTYAKSDDAFLADIATGKAAFGIDLVGTYGKPEYAYSST